MKYLCALVLGLVLLNCSGCGADTHESLAGEQVSTMKEIVGVLDGVKDEDSAKSAKPKVKSLMEKLNDISTRESKLKAPSEADMKATEGKYGKEMDDVSRKFQANMFRIIGDPKIAAVFQDIDMKGAGK